MSTVNSNKSYLIAIAVLATSAGVMAPFEPLAGSLLAFLTTTVAAYRILAENARPVAASAGNERGTGGGPVAGALPTLEPTQGSEPPGAHSSKSEPAGPGSSELGGYRRVRQLAHGTMGALWLVRHDRLGRVAALKEIRGTEVDEEDLRRFEREARVVAALHCPHTIQIFDFGVGPEGAPYFVMEYLYGENLQKLVDAHGPMPPARVVSVLRQIGASLEEAHSRGLVHRDIKPANVMVCQYGTSYDFIKLLDFGLVKGKKQDASSITRDAVVLGTPAYLAPESLMGSKFVDARVDIYALGAVGFFLLTGRLMFEHDHPVKMAKAHLSEPAPRASGFVDLPPALDDLLDDCLKKDPEKRPQSARELIERLDALDVGEPWSQAQAKAWWADYRKRNAS